MIHSSNNGDVSELLALILLAPCHRPEHLSSAQTARRADSPCAVEQITSTFPAIPPALRGAYRDRHDTRGGMRWAPGVVAWLVRADERLGAHVENVWSWHLDADATPAVTMIRRSRGQDSRSPGRVRIRRQSIAQGMPVDGWTCGDCRLLFLLQAGHGLRPAARHSLRPRFERG